MQFRIGDRDPVTGLYDVIWPDGSFTRNGMKIFNSAHEFGDVVQVTRRSDGMLILDGVKAADTDGSTPLTEIGLKGFGEKPVGYLNGQVFNNEEEVILPVVSIDFAPNSPEELEPGDGTFVFRLKLDRVRGKETKVKCKISGTADESDYTIDSGLTDLIASIPAGSEFVDIEISPLVTAVGGTIIIEIAPGSYRINTSKDSITGTIQGLVPVASISLAQGSPASSEFGPFIIRFEIDAVQDGYFTILCKFEGLGLDNVSVPSLDLTDPNFVSVVIAPGQTFSDVEIYVFNSPVSAETLEISLLVDAAYTIDAGNDVVTVTILPPPISYQISSSVAIESGPPISSVSIGGRAQDVGKLIACIFESVDFSGASVVVQDVDLIVNYSLFGTTIGGVNFVTPIGATVGSFATTGSVTIPVGSSSTTLFIEPIIAPSLSGSFQVGVSNLPIFGSLPTVSIVSPKIASLTASDLQSTNLPGGWSGNDFITSAYFYYDVYPEPSAPIVIGFSGSGVREVNYSVFDVYGVKLDPAITSHVVNYFPLQVRFPTFVANGSLSVTVEVLADDGYDIGTPPSISLTLI